MMTCWSLGRLHLVLTTDRVIGTTFFGRPSNWTSTAGLVSFTNKTSSTGVSLDIYEYFHPAIVASAPFVTQHSVATLCFTITGIP